MRRNHYVIKLAVVLAIITLGWMAAPGLRAPLPWAPMEIGGRLGMAAGIGSPDDAAVRHFPKLRTRASNRHLLEDENGKAFFMAGVCPQNMVHWSTPDQMDAYFADRQARHFNFAWVVVNGFDFPVAGSERPSTNPTDAHGNSMLLHGTSWNPQNLNPAYVASVDALSSLRQIMAYTCFWIRSVLVMILGPPALILPAIQMTRCDNGVNSGATATRTTPISISPWEMTDWFGRRSTALWTASRSTCRTG